VAVGRAAILDDIGLEEAGVKVEKGFIKVDAKMRTSAEGVYAIGDCAGPPLLAHKASHEGIAAVEHIAGDEHAGVDYGNIPAVTYCHPEVASCGMTEAQAKEAGHEIDVGKFPFSANGRARTAGETDGHVKIIRDRKYGEVLGAHIVGPHASELIGEFIVGRHLETTAEGDGPGHASRIPTLSGGHRRGGARVAGPRAPRLAGTATAGRLHERVRGLGPGDGGDGGVAGGPRGVAHRDARAYVPGSGRAAAHAP
jgi:pyruvate/2-oxoglutarate dehydrogenase complex dihydrolipoamide dehydrogenase (E3) component